MSMNIFLCLSFYCYNSALLIHNICLPTSNNYDFRKKMTEFIINHRSILFIKSIYVLYSTVVCILIRIFSSTLRQEMRKTRRNFINFLVVCIPNGRGRFDTRQKKYIPYFIDFSRRIFNFIFITTNTRVDTLHHKV